LPVFIFNGIKFFLRSKRPAIRTALPFPAAFPFWLPMVSFFSSFFLLNVCGERKRAAAAKHLGCIKPEATKTHNVMSEREEYLRNLAEDYGVPASFVFELAYILGESEDFDGLIVCLDDIACRHCEILDS
jgi:hypothetical protein